MTWVGKSIFLIIDGLLFKGVLFYTSSLFIWVNLFLKYQVNTWNSDSIRIASLAQSNRNKDFSFAKGARRLSCTPCTIRKHRNKYMNQLSVATIQLLYFKWSFCPFRFRLCSGQGGAGAPCLMPLETSFCQRLCVAVADSKTSDSSQPVRYGDTSKKATLFWSSSPRFPVLRDASFW